MTAATRAFLYYLRRYIGKDSKRRAALCRFHLERTRRAINTGNLTRHLLLRNQPNMDTTLCYLSFLHRAGELIPARRKNGLFHYKHPEWLRARKK